MPDFDVRNLRLARTENQLEITDGCRIWFDCEIGNHRKRQDVSVREVESLTDCGIDFQSEACDQVVDIGSCDTDGDYFRGSVAGRNHQVENAAKATRQRVQRVARGDADLTLCSVGDGRLQQAHSGAGRQARPGRENVVAGRVFGRCGKDRNAGFKFRHGVAGKVVLRAAVEVKAQIGRGAEADADVSVPLELNPDAIIRGHREVQPRKQIGQL